MKQHKRGTSLVYKKVYITSYCNTLRTVQVYRTGYCNTHRELYRFSEPVIATHRELYRCIEPVIATHSPPCRPRWGSCRRGARSRHGWPSHYWGWDPRQSWCQGEYVASKIRILSRKIAIFQLFSALNVYFAPDYHNIQACLVVVAARSRDIWRLSSESPPRGLFWWTGKKSNWNINLSLKRHRMKTIAQAPL